MPGSVFYVKDNSGNLVQAQFLQYNGSYVTDPNSTAILTNIYDQNGNYIPNSNPNGYLIVPADYSIDSAISFGQSVADEMNMQGTSLNGEEGTGFLSAIGTMIGGFAYGPQDLQRNYNGHTGEFVPAFTDATSYNLGVVSAYAGIPLSLSERGGGLLNDIGNIFGSRTQPLDTDGPQDLTFTNGNSIVAGYTLGKTLPGASGALADPSTITIDGELTDPFSNTTITFLSDGTVQVIQNLNAGGSVSGSFAPENNGSNLFQYNLTGYSGSNATGTQLYQQNTSTDNTGQTTSTISAGGVVANIDGSDPTVSLDNSGNVQASLTPSSVTGLSLDLQFSSNFATLDEGGNSVLAAGSGSSITEDDQGNFDVSSNLAGWSQTTALNFDGSFSQRFSAEDAQGNPISLTDYFQPLTAPVVSSLNWGGISISGEGTQTFANAFNSNVPAFFR